MMLPRRRASQSARERGGTVIHNTIEPAHGHFSVFFAGALGGAINAVAGGGSFVSFPALLFTGVPAIPANATNTLALWVGTTASGGAYREKLNITRRVMIRW